MFGRNGDDDTGMTPDWAPRSMSLRTLTGLIIFLLIGAVAGWLAGLIQDVEGCSVVS
jgi:hypothetical protein